METLVIEKSKQEYLRDIATGIEPLRSRVLRRWHLWTGNYDHKKEFEGLINDDTFVIRENNRLKRRSSPVLKGIAYEVEKNKTEVHYKILMDKEVIMIDIVYLLLTALILFFMHMPQIAYVIVLGLLTIFLLIDLCLGFISYKKKYVDFIKRMDQTKLNS